MSLKGHRVQSSVADDTGGVSGQPAKFPTNSLASRLCHSKLNQNRHQTGGSVVFSIGCPFYAGDSLMEVLWCLSLMAAMCVFLMGLFSHLFS